MKVNSVLLREILAIGALLLIAAVGIYFWNNRTLVVTAPFADTLTHSLPDDSKVVLYDRSSMKYSKEIWEKGRTILLLGDAFFTMKNGRVFQVKTSSGTVEGLEAKFTIQSLEDKLYVECYAGKITINSYQQEITLTANQAVNIANGVVEEVQV